MHGSVRGGLKSLLAAKPSKAAYPAAAEVSELLKTLRPSAELEPSAGFYARVMQRIEERAKHSIWWVFVYKPIGKRLAYASLAVAIALGSYVVASETSDGHLSSPMFTQAADSQLDVPVTGDTEQQRQAVLANFASSPSTTVAE